MHDVCAVDVDAPAAPTGRDGHQYDAVLIVCEDGVEVKLERSLGDLHELAEEAENGVPPAVFTRDLIPSAFVPLQVLGEQVVEDDEIALGEGGVPVPDASYIRMLGNGYPSEL